MEKLLKIWNFLDGRKVYVLGTCITIEGLISKDWNRVFEGLTVLAGRQAISKLEN